MHIFLADICICNSRSEPFQRFLASKTEEKKEKS